jgi:hypothetical protein
MKHNLVYTKKKTLAHTKSENAACVDVLRAIKMRDPYLTYGEIISIAVQRKALRSSQVGLFLKNVTDKNFEKLLKDYFEVQK